MSGRDPHEGERASSPLELLLDLTFVVAVGIAASHFAEMLAEGHLRGAMVGFMLAMSAISVAWIGFSWFASAFDTDDWLYRLITMVQMAGVVLFALGLPVMFHSVEEGHRLDLRVMIVGYVVMRGALTLQWWRASRAPKFHDVAMANIYWTGVMQIGWLAVAFVDFGLSNTVIFTMFGVLAVVELLLPALTGSVGRRLPWHPHHIAERYGLFTIIVLGESVVGTVASSSDLLGGGSAVHWSADVIAIVVAGIGLTFGMWWVYFSAPFGDALDRRRGRAYLFGYGHIPLFIAVAAVGGGLHVAGLVLEEHSEIGPVAVVLALAIPVGTYLLAVYALYSALLAATDLFHVLLLAATMGVLAAAVGLAVAGVSVAVCLLVIMFAPFITVVGYETIGRRHQQVLLQGERV
ncbi:low temperature requirement protein A [Rhodococcus qingshengii]